MKNFILLLIFTTIAHSQQFPVNCFKMYSAVNGETPLTHTQQIAKTFPLYQSASFNYGLPFIIKDYTTHTTLSDAEIQQLLDSAAVHNVNIILPDVMSSYSGAERFYLDANDQYFSYRQGDFVSPPDPDAEQPDPIFYDHTALKATVANDYMVKDVKYSPSHPWYKNASYNAYFRLKVSRSGSPPGNTPVVDIEVWDLTPTPSLYSKKTLLSQDFASDNTYYTFSRYFYTSQYCVQSSSSSSVASLSLSAQSSLLAADESMPLDLKTSSVTCYPHSFDIRVKWHGQIQVWLDNIRIDGSNNPSGLFSGSYDNQIKTAAKKFNNKPALARFYLKDEPYMNQYLAYNKVNQLLKVAAQENGITPGTGKGLGYTAKCADDSWYGTYNRFTQEVTPFELATDIYKFYYWDPLPSDPTYTTSAQISLQSAINQFRSAQQNSVYTESRTWQYFPNISRWPGATREPYLAEVYAQVNLALAYGTKGVHYFHYWTLNDGNSDFPIGLIDPATLDPINSTSQYSIYGEDKWDGIKSLNQKLAGTVGTTLMQLTWQNAFSIHQGQPTSTFITSVFFVRCSKRKIC